MTVRNVASNASVVGLASVLLVVAIGAQQQAGESCPGLGGSAPAEWRSPEGYGLYLSMPLIAPIRDGTLWLGQLLSIRKGPNDFLWPFVPRGARAFTNSTEVQIGAVVARDGR